MRSHSGTPNAPIERSGSDAIRIRSIGLGGGNDMEKDDVEADGVEADGVEEDGVEEDGVEEDDVEEDGVEEDDLDEDDEIDGDDEDRPTSLTIRPMTTFAEWSPGARSTVTSRLFASSRSSSVNTPVSIAG